MTSSAADQLAGLPATHGQWPATSPLVSVIVPVLNESRELPRLLDHLDGLPGRFEVLVADGGSSDGSAAIAAGHPLGVAVVDASGGRARQLNAAATRARGEMLVFLHADSRLPRDAFESLARAYHEADVVGGNFALRFDGDDRFSQTLGAFYALQSRFGFYYGDSSIWVRRDAFRRLDGFRELPIMDDYDFVRRMEVAGRTIRLPGPALTSARRWRRLGILRTLFSWLVIRWLFLLGVPPDRLASLYRRVR